MLHVELAMKMSHLGLEREELEQRLRKLVADAIEAPKLDLKRDFEVVNSAQKLAFAKDLSAIANTDDEQHHDDFGYIILGAERGKLVGGIEGLADPDKLQAHLTNVAKEYLSPVPQFFPVCFVDDTVGRWGAIVVPPSFQQPHVFTRDFSGNPAKHEWCVRINDTTERAGAADYARILSKVNRRAVAPMERELQRAMLRIEALENRPVLVQAGSAATAPASLAARLRADLETPRHAAEDALVTEALSVVNLMSEDSPSNPWLFPSAQPDDLAAIIRHLEDGARPLAEALGTIARYDTGGEFTDAVVRALRVVARKPQVQGPYHSQVPPLRLYPIVLCLYTITLVAAQEERWKLLRDVYNIPFDPEGYPNSPLVAAVRYVRGSGEVFRSIVKADYFEPIAEQASRTVSAWCAPLIPGRNAIAAFHAAEFLLALAYLDATSEDGPRAVPLPGRYMYFSDARVTLEQFLASHPPWLESLFPKLAGLLAQFDATARQMVDPMCGFRQGFTGGAVKAWGAEAT